MRYLIACLIFAAFYYGSNADDLAKCEERMSREVCLHTLYR